MSVVSVVSGHFFFFRVLLMDLVDNWETTKDGIGRSEVVQGLYWS